jgi:hypothetical protein
MPQTNYAEHHAWRKCINNKQNIMTSIKLLGAKKLWKYSEKA